MSLTWKPVAAALLCLALAGCTDDWKVLSVSDLHYPDDCSAAGEHLDPTASHAGVPRWSADGTQGEACATVLVKLLEADPGEPLPASLTLTTAFSVVQPDGSVLRRGAAYTFEPTVVSKLRVVALVTGGTAQTGAPPEAPMLELAGAGIELTRCILDLAGGTVDCD